MATLAEIKLNSRGIEFILDTKLDLATIPNISKKQLHLHKADNNEVIYNAEIVETKKLKFMQTGATDFAVLGHYEIITYIETTKGYKYYGATYEFEVVEKYKNSSK